MLLLSATACMDSDYGGAEESFDEHARGLFIVCEGNFQYGNSSLSYYNSSGGEVLGEVFYRANGMKLGDVAQSMTIHGDKGWIVVNNSHVIFAINVNTFKEKGRIENLTSPRYIHFISDEKAYVTQLWDNRIFIVNPRTYSVTGYITVPGMSMESGSTEQMVQQGKYVFCTCWSYQNRIIKIDTETDRVVGDLTVGIQPESLVTDRLGRLWVMTDGGYEGSPYGHEAPALYCIDATALSIERQFLFRNGDTPRGLMINGSGETLYWINDDVWRMDVMSETMPVSPFIESIGTKYYGMTIDPVSEDIYVADAIDYQQKGKIFRYSKEGVLVDEFYSGITPSAFCWKTNSEGAE